MSKNDGLDADARAYIEECRTRLREEMLASAADTTLIVPAHFTADGFIEVGPERIPDEVIAAARDALQKAIDEDEIASWTFSDSVPNKSI